MMRAPTCSTRSAFALVPAVMLVAAVTVHAQTGTAPQQVMNEVRVLDWLRVLLPLVPAILAPLIPWYLSQRGLAQRFRHFEHLLKRVELVGRLRSLEADSHDPTRREALAAEIDDILGDLAALRESEQVQVGAAAGITRWRRYLLLFEQPSRMGRIYKVLFYTLLALASLVAVAMIPNGDWEVMGFSVGFYLIIALLFRRAALREYKRKLEQPITASEGEQPGTSVTQ